MRRFIPLWGLNIWPVYFIVSSPSEHVLSAIKGVIRIYEYYPYGTIMILTYRFLSFAIMPKVQEEQEVYCEEVFQEVWGQ